jgi:hypothetical protein
MEMTDKEKVARLEMALEAILIIPYEALTCTHRIAKEALSATQVRMYIKE